VHTTDYLHPHRTWLVAQIHNKPMTFFAREPVSSDFPSEIVPSYSSAVFELRNFTEVCIIGHSACNSQRLIVCARLVAPRSVGRKRSCTVSPWLLTG